jgi:hypothetical protein
VSNPPVEDAVVASEASVVSRVIKPAMMTTKFTPDVLSAIPCQVACEKQAEHDPVNSRRFSSWWE